MTGKPKLAMYWAASCGGCEVSLVNIDERLLDLDAHFDFMFCPCLMDTKKSELEALPDGAIAVTLFNGAIRTSENEEMARLLRQKSQLLVAFGSCAKGGCIPALSNLHSRKDHFAGCYLDGPSIHNPAAVLPRTETAVPEGILHLPEFYQTVKTLAQTVQVDYFIPGCPPESEQVWKVVEQVMNGLLPAPGAVIGAGRTTVCEECPRKKEDKRITRLYRSYEIIPDPERCLLEQGLLCLGIATRDGCGALCPGVNTPCTGCYGPPEGTSDQGAAMVAALGSIIDVGNVKGISEEELNDRIEKVIAAVPDYAGTFYKYSLAESILRGAVKKRDEKE